MAPGFEKHDPPISDRKTRKKGPIQYYEIRNKNKRGSQSNESNVKVEDRDDEKLHDEDDSSSLTEPPSSEDEIQRPPKPKLKLKKTTAAVQKANQLALKRRGSELHKAVTKKPKKTELSPKEKQRQEEAHQRRLAIVERLEKLCTLAEDIEGMGLPVSVSDRLLELARVQLKAFSRTSSLSETCSNIIQRHINKIIEYVDRQARPQEWQEDGVRDTINMIWAILSTRNDATAEEYVQEIEQLRKDIREKDDLLKTQADHFAAELGKVQTEKIQIQTSQLKLSKEDMVSELQKQLSAAQTKITKLQSEKADSQGKHEAQMAKHVKELKRTSAEFNHRKEKLQADITKQREARELAVKDLKTEMVQREKEARNAKTDKLEAKLAEHESEIVDLRNQNAVLTLRVDNLSAENAKHGTAMRELSTGYEQRMSADRVANTKKHMCRLLASMAKTNHAEKQFKHEQTLRHEADQKTERFRIQNSNNIALADRLNRSMRAMKRTHAEQIAQMQEEIAEWGNERFEVEQEIKRLTDLCQDMKREEVGVPLVGTETSSVVDGREEFESRVAIPMQTEESMENFDDGQFIRNGIDKASSASDTTMAVTTHLEDYEAVDDITGVEEDDDDDDEDQYATTDAGHDTE